MSSYLINLENILKTKKIQWIQLKNLSHKKMKNAFGAIFAALREALEKKHDLWKLSLHK